MYFTKLEAVMLNEGLKKISRSAFDGCRLLMSIVLPSTMIDIGDCAFLNCPRLEKGVLNEGLQTIENIAFIHCELLTPCGNG